MKKRNYSLVIVLAVAAIFTGHYLVTANVAQTDATGSLASAVTIPVSLPAVSAPNGATIAIPITVGDMTGLGVQVFDMQVSFNPAVIVPATPAFDSAGTLSTAMTITPNATNAGHLIIGAFQGSTLSGGGTLIYLRFNVVGTLGQTTALTFANYTDPGSVVHPGFQFNEGDPAASTTNGSFTVIAATATSTATATFTPTPTFTPTLTATQTPTFTSTNTPTNTATATATGTPVVPAALPIMTASPGALITVPITVGNTTGQGILSCDLQVTFNQAVVVPASPPFDSAGTLTAGWSILSNPNYPGHLIVSSFSGSPMNGSGTMLNLRFNVVGAAGQTTGLTFENYTDPMSIFHPGFKFNEGIPPSSATNGFLTVAVATATSTNTATATSTATFTPTATNTATFTPTATSTSTFTPTSTSTSTFTPTSTSTSTFTPTFTATSTFTPTATNTATFTPTFTPTVVPTPILGNYGNATIPLSTNTTVAPDAAPLLATSMNVSTSTNFKGKLEADPTTGIVRVTDAHPAGIYPITVTAFGFMGVTNTRTFTLTVNTPPVCNPVSFAPVVNFDVGIVPQNVVAGDFNGDGKQDLATANYNSGSNNLSILIGDGAGGFSSATDFSTGTNPLSLAVGDLNGDGKQDIAVARPNANSVSVLLGDGTGNFGIASNFGVGIAPVSLLVADFNGDGKQDIATANNNSGNPSNVSILMGNGTGGFSAANNFTVGSGPRSVTVGDFNGDSKQDLAVANFVSNNISILLGDGFGNFGLPVNIGTVGAGRSPVSVSIADLNGDGNQDLAVAVSPMPKMLILLGDGTGNFGPSTYFDVAPTLYTVAISDLNGDGNQDIVTTSYDSNTLSVLLGDGGGNFGSAIIFATGNKPTSVSVGDFNGDGKQDLAVTHETAHNVSIFLRDCTISGSVVYGNAVGSPSTRYVSNVQVNAAGTPAASATTLAPGAGEGTYKLDLLGAGPYTVTPAKTGGVNGAINSFDAGKIAAHVTAISLLTGNALAAADVSGNGLIQSFDAAQIARYVTALGGSGSTGQWKFFTVPNVPFPIGSTPTSRTYASLTANLAGQDYTALLMGEVSGNWNNTGARSVGSSGGNVSSPHVSKGALPNGRATDTKATDTVRGPVRGVTVEAAGVVSEFGKEVVVPVRVDGAANKDIISYEFDLRYDTNVIQPIADPVDLAETVSRGMFVKVNPKRPGLLRVAVYGPVAMSEDGVLLNLRFVAVGKIGSVSPLTWERMLFNEGEPRVTASNGRVEIGRRSLAADDTDDADKER